MKDQILKIAGVKSEKEFYKKYPSEESFMKAHKKEFKKAAMGSKMVNDQLHQLTDWDNPPVAQYGIGMKKKPQNFNGYFQGTNQPGLNPDGSMKQVGDAFNNASVAQYSGQQMASDMSSQFATPSSDQLLGKNDINSGAAAKAGGADFGAAGKTALNNLDKIASGISAIGAQKKAQKKAEQSYQLSGLALQASQTMEKPKNQYVTPYDVPVQPGQLGNPYGTGTNYLQAQNGRVIRDVIGGNPTEIQNTYAPTNDIYNDLGFEPLQETYKQYRHGGYMPKAEFGEYFQDSGQAQVGSAVGESIGSAFGPAGAAIGKFAGKIAGNLLGGAKDARALQAQKDKTALNQSQLAFQQARSQGPLNAYMENGGWVSHDWQPQVITTFGEHKLSDLLRPPHDADMLRAGGHLKEYTAPSAEAMFTGRPGMPRAQYGTQMAMGGELEVGDGGHFETMSYNPNLPGGEIGMFRGASHDNGGIPINFGENEVEVEGGEPAVKLQDGGSSDNLVVFGNMKINKNIADLIGDPKSKGMKFKTYISDIGKNDAKQLKRINKGLKLIENSNENSAFDHLSLNTGHAILEGAKAWQKINAQKIKDTAIVQDAIHQTAKELGVKNDKLAEGKLEKETDPSMVAQNGKRMSKKEWENFSKPYVDPNPQTFGEGHFDVSGYKNVNAANKSITSDQYGNYFDTAGNVIDQSGDLPGAFSNPNHPSFGSKVWGATKAAGKFLGKGAEKYGPTALSNLENFLRPSNANENLPPDQLYPEYYALATNQLEPVKAQTFQPMLDSPVDISLSDQLAAADAQSRAAIRAAGSNPAAQAMIMAQTLQAKNQILGEQNRINQTNKLQVYDKNRATINDAQLRNLQILDQQYTRQAQAKSNTKEQTLAALSSIAAKTAQQRAANRKMAVLENMYGFRFSPDGKVYNANQPAQFNTSGDPFSRSSMTGGRGIAPGYAYNYDELGRVIGTRREKDTTTNPSLSELDNYMQKNGGKTKARNSSIVKALKNL